MPRLQISARHEQPKPLSIEIGRGEVAHEQVMADGLVLTAAPRKNDLPPPSFRYCI